MIQISAYIYPNRVDAYVAPIEDYQSTTRFRQVYNRNLKIYRSADNRIDIRVKNSSQRLTNIGDSAIVFRIIAEHTQRLLFERDCVIQDPTQGICYVDITRHDLERLEQGAYRCTLTQEFRIPDPDGYIVDRSVPLYIDSQFGAELGLIVAGDMQGQFQPSIEINKFVLTNPRFLSEPEPRFYVSSIIDANPMTSTPQSLHTFQFYFSDHYQGRVVIEASFDEQGATPYRWFPVHEFEPELPRTSCNVAGKYNWFRIKHYPEVESDPIDPAIETELGTIDKVLFR